MNHHKPMANGTRNCISCCGLQKVQEKKLYECLMLWGNQIPILIQLSLGVPETFAVHIGSAAAKASTVQDSSIQRLLMPDRPASQQ
jgi:hypothetical protein